MDGFTGFKTASAEELPDAATVMDPFHVVRLAGNALDECRRRVQLATAGTAAARPTRSTARGEPCRPEPICSPTSKEPGWRPCSPTTPTPRSKPPGRCTSAP